MNDTCADGAMDPPAQETADRERGPNTRDRASRTSTAAGSPASVAHRHEAGGRVGTDAVATRRACAHEVTVQRVPVGGIRLVLLRTICCLSRHEAGAHEPAKRGATHYAGRLGDRLAGCRRTAPRGGADFAPEDAYASGPPDSGPHRSTGLMPSDRPRRENPAFSLGIPGNRSCARSATLRGSASVGLVLSANANPYEQKRTSQEERRGSSLSRSGETSSRRP